MKNDSGQDPEDCSSIKNGNGEIVVIKYGGNAMVDPDIKSSVIEDIYQLKSKGFKPVVVHGGGPVIEETLDTAGVESKFIDGQRKTNTEAMKYVEMALRGNVNGELVRLLNHRGLRAVGISGKDGGIARVVKREHFVDTDEGRSKVDLGYVGDVDKVDTSLILLLLNNDYIPILAPVCLGDDGKDYNVNADLFAGHIAGALHADRFMLLTNVDGLLADLNDVNSLMKHILTKDLDQHIGKTIQGGMIPKVNSCRVALELGVKKAHIINGTKPHSLIEAILDEQPIGTVISN
ncbi:MAG TPA: acetylglutamate kinase [Balneolales bacterium]|nr:acetylglutamate kinase [Balneolales bacterium]